MPSGAGRGPSIAHTTITPYNARVPPVLRVENVSRTYAIGQQTIHALDGVTLRVDAGEFLAIMGSSGSGKSTLLHLMGGLDLPTAGFVELDGRDLTSLSDRARTLLRRQRVGFVYQAFNLLETLSAAENAALPLLIAGQSRRVASQRSRSLLEQVDMAHRASHRPSALSGGEQQRVAIARALVNDPAVLLADEPTGNLDSTHEAEIWRLLRRLADEQARTIVAVTHEAFGAAFADRIVVLKDGAVVGEFPSQGKLDAAHVAARYQKLAG